MCMCVWGGRKGGNFPPLFLARLGDRKQRQLGDDCIINETERQAFRVWGSLCGEGWLPSGVCCPSKSHEGNCMKRADDLSVRVWCVCVGGGSPNLRASNLQGF